MLSLPHFWSQTLGNGPPLTGSIERACCQKLEYHYCLVAWPWRIPILLYWHVWYKIHYARRILKNEEGHNILELVLRLTVVLICISHYRHLLMGERYRFQRCKGYYFWGEPWFLIVELYLILYLSAMPASRTRSAGSKGGTVRIGLDIVG